jgi:hypothetical protein
MRISLLAIPFLFALAPAALPQGDSHMPVMATVEPGSGASGDVLTVAGANLGADVVAALYLTDGKTDVKTIIVQQTATSITFRIPPEARAGRVALMVLTTGKDSRLIEEPVKVTVEPPPPRPAS